ncbi:MAG TPA: PP2C family protein-serine/threonine phosphatase [Bacteroidota bacterium]|jgi:sigma-B regulation protein RsbU (phosphoserine phosphatase)|nr:PP2C family protein-serine/threonine phosphatase [Bacteroidota bacterium]
MQTTTNNPKIGQVLRDDFRNLDFKRDIPKDYRAMRDFFIDDEKKARLKEMRRFKRWIYTGIWLLKSLFLKLTPARRVLLTLGVVILLTSESFNFRNDSVNISVNTSILSSVILLFILMLELKDKLIAHTELGEGKAVQEALMPERSPQVPGWSLYLYTKTANEVGGDLVDFQKTGPETYLASLADVAGKGLKAALVTSKLQSTLRALSTESSSLSNLAAKINAVFHRDTIRTMFASLLCIEFSPGSGGLGLVNAGHLPPVKVTASGVEELGKGDPAIGIIPEITYSQQSIQLGEGEVLVVYSDGLPDAKNIHGEFFGTSRLFDILRRSHGLSTSQIADNILYSVQSFIGEEKVYDDLSMIVMKRTSSPITI